MTALMLQQIGARGTRVAVAQRHLAEG